MWKKSRTLDRVRRGEATVRAVDRSEESWRDQLSAQQFHVLREKGTERPFSGEAVTPDEAGVFRCAACGAGLFSADSKFDSGTGWPSFSASEPDGVELHRDFRMGVPRTEVVCRACGGHLGHVFNDGPRPTGKRYCINGCSLAPDGRAPEGTS